MMERGWIPPIEKREELIKTLKDESDMEYNEIMNLIQRYSEWMKYLPSYSLRLNQNLDSINKRMNSVIPFKYVGNSPNKRLIGFVDEVFISDDKEVLWEADYEDDKMTEFTNGLWTVEEFETLEDSIKFLKDEHIPSVINEN